MKSSGNGIFCRHIHSVRELVWIEGGWETSFDMLYGQPIKALYNDQCKWSVYWMVVLEAADNGLFRQWDDWQSSGKILYLDRDRLKIFVKTSDSWSAHNLNILLVTPSGPAPFLGFSTLTLTSCSCTVST